MSKNDITRFEAIWKRARTFQTSVPYVMMRDGRFYNCDGDPLTSPEEIDRLPPPWRAFAEEQAACPWGGPVVWQRDGPTALIDLDIGDLALTDVPCPPEWLAWLAEAGLGPASPVRFVANVEVYPQGKYVFAKITPMDGPEASVEIGFDNAVHKCPTKKQPVVVAVPE